MARTAAEVIANLEKLLYEFHEIDPNKPSEADGAMIVGVEFLIAFDISIIQSDGSRGGVTYAYQGNQTSTVTLGLANRAAAFADEHAYGVDD